MKKIAVFLGGLFISVVLCSLIGCGVSSEEHTRLLSEMDIVSGFKSPEDVVKYLVQNIRTGNFENAMKTSAYYYDDIIDKLNAEAFAKGLNAILPGSPLSVPKEYRSLIKARFLGQHAMNIQMFIASLLLPEEYSSFSKLTPLMLNGSEQLFDRYFSTLSNITTLNSLELVRMDVSYPESQYSDRHKQYVEKQKLCYNFDEAIEYTALFKLNGKYYWGGYIFYCYNDNWYISYYNASLTGQSSFGAVEQIPGIEEYLYEFDIDK
jgi:hypothetical protein